MANNHKNYNPQQMLGLLQMQGGIGGGAGSGGGNAPTLQDATQYLSLLNQQGFAEDDRAYQMQQRQRQTLLQGRADDSYAAGQARLDPNSAVSQQARDWFQGLGMPVAPNATAANLEARWNQFSAAEKAKALEEDRKLRTNAQITAEEATRQFRKDTLERQDAAAVAQAKQFEGAPAAAIKLVEEKATVKKNSTRLQTLNDSAVARKMSIKKAKYFLEKFESGEMSSGRYRQALDIEGPFGLKLPVLTKQGQLDEELDTFTETAARAELKALGEIRPTDADVKGMKVAMFGIGRNLETNINLLRQFIAKGEAGNDELSALKSASKANTLGTFIYEAPSLLAGEGGDGPSEKELALAELARRRAASGGLLGTQ